MKTEKLHQSAHNATTIKQSNRPASHLLYNSPTFGLFFIVFEGYERWLQQNNNISPLYSKGKHFGYKLTPNFLKTNK